MPFSLSFRASTTHLWWFVLYFMNIFFPLTLCGFRGHPYKVLQCTSHLRRRGSAFSVRVVKYWNKFRASAVTAPSANIFKKRLEKVWTVVLPHLPHWLKSQHPNSLTLPPQTARNPLTVPTSICCPNPCFMYVGSSGPLWPAYYH